MNNRFNIHKDIGDIINNYEEQTVTPYISISDSSNMQVESSHFSINNKNSTSLINNNLQNNQEDSSNNANNKGNLKKVFTKEEFNINNKINEEEDEYNKSQDIQYLKIMN